MGDEGVEQLPLTVGMLERFLLQLTLETPTLGQERTANWYARAMLPYIEKYGQSCAASLRAEIARLEKERDAWQALYAEAREVICCCNRTNTPEKGPSYDYTCEWCEAHPEGDVVIGLLERAEAAEARIRELEEK